MINVVKCFFVPLDAKFDAFVFSVWWLKPICTLCYCRYLVPADLTVGQFVYVVRKRIKLNPEKAIFIFVKNVLPPTGETEPQYSVLFNQNHIRYIIQSIFFLVAAALMSAIFEEHKDEDGFLYMTYSGENTFGVL